MITFGYHQLDGNIFSDVTFQHSNGHNIRNIGSNVFNKTAIKTKYLFCWHYLIKFRPPKYNIQTALNQMTELIELLIGFNTT